MTVQLNHTIVPARDPQASAQFLAEILGLSVDPPLAHFTPVTLANQVSLDYDQLDDFAPHHYAFMVSETEFDEIWGRTRDRGLPFRADPAHRQPDQINTHDGGRGLYWDDPDGHSLEIITRPYGSGA